MTINNDYEDTNPVSDDTEINDDWGQATERSMPLDVILAAADRGSFFRGPIRIFFYLIGVGLLLMCLNSAYMNYDLGSRAVELAKKNVELTCGEELKKTCDDASRSRWAKKKCERAKESCKAAKEQAKSVNVGWFSCLGFILFGFAGLQIYFYRAKRLVKDNIPRFHVTPILVEILKASGEVFAFACAIMGICSGIDFVLFNSGVFSPLPGFLGTVTASKAAGIILGPLLGFFVMLVSHGLTELISSLVCIAEHTLMTAESTKSISDSTLVTAEIAMKTAENTQALAEQAGLKNG